jgi:hypothetical protein
MRTWRIVTFVTLAVLSLGLLIILSTPFRFPGYIILPFRPVLTFLIPAFAICALLLARLFISQRTFSILLIATATAFTLLWLAGSMAPVVLMGSFIALALVYFASRSIRAHDQDPTPVGAA